MSATAAELMYIRIVQQLPEYGHESFDALVGLFDYQILWCCHGYYYRMVLVLLSELEHASLVYL